MSIVQPFRPMVKPCRTIEAEAENPRADEPVAAERGVPRGTGRRRDQKRQRGSGRSHQAPLSPEDRPEPPTK